MTALKNLKVIDASESIAGQFCGRMLADYGADVTLIEPPGGSSIRLKPPLDTATKESFTFAHINLGKKSITIDSTTKNGKKLLDAAIADTDVALVGKNFKLSDNIQNNERLIICQITPFGNDGPYENWHGEELIFQALSGMMNHNGDSLNEPLYGCGNRASYSAGLAAYICILAALEARHKVGSQILSIDIAETISSMWYPYSLIYAYNGWLEPRGERGQPLGRVKCQDGSWVCFWIMPHQWTTVCNVLNRTDLISDSRFNNSIVRQKNWSCFVDIVQNIALQLNSDQLLAMWQKNGLIISKAYTLTELLELPHLIERQYWDYIETGRGKNLLLGPQFRMSESPRKVSSSAPKLDE